MEKLTVHRHDDEGATVVEYSLLAALVVGLCITVVNLFGSQIGSVLDKLTGQIAS